MFPNWLTVPQAPEVPMVYQGQPCVPLQVSNTALVGYVMYSKQPQPQTVLGYISSSEESIDYQQPVQYQKPLTPTQMGQYMYVQNAPSPSLGHIMMTPPAAQQTAANITTTPPLVMLPPVQQSQQVQEQPSSETPVKVTPKKSEKDESPFASPLDDSSGSEFLYLRISKSDLDKPEIKRLLETLGQVLLKQKVRLKCLKRLISILKL